MELTLTALQFSALLLAGALSIILVLHRLYGPRSPPGPRGIPIFGYLFRMRQMLQNPLDFQSLVLRHGPIVQIPLGSIPLIIISSPALAHEALIEKGSLFSSRPKFSSRRQLLMSNFRRSINAAPYGTHWRTARRNLVSHVLNPVRVHSFAPARYRAVSELVQHLREADAAVPVLDAIRRAVFSILAYMCFGVWLEEARVGELQSFMREVIRGASRGSLSDFVPLLKIFSNPLRKSDGLADELKVKRDEVLMPLVQRSKKLADSGELDSSCYFASLLDLQQELGLTGEDYLTLCSEFLNAGADTTANSLEWCLACVIKHPGVQEKVYEEIRGVVGDGGEELSEKHLEKLVYLQSVVKETLRMHPPGYTTLPHAVSQPCKLAGYDIPTNASLLFNIHAINNDPEVWERPGEFLPDRFIGERGVHGDYSATSGQQLSLIPFGAGRRICPGLGLATLHMHYILARLVQEFEWSSEDGVVDLTPKQEFTVVMKNSLRATVRARNK